MDNEKEPDIDAIEEARKEREEDVEEFKKVELDDEWLKEAKDF